MKKIDLVFGIHLHQPVGNFESVFRLAAEKSYIPFLKIVKDYPFFKFALHISGPLWEYFEKNYGLVFEIIGELLERGQVELWGGGFYEPILAVVPERDALGQLEMMNEYLMKKFGKVPKGMWLAERVWEPHLPSLLAKAGIVYTIVDDYHFKSVGVSEDSLFGYYITEHDGSPLIIFPISQRLRYTIPFGDAQKTIGYLIDSATEWGERTAIYADDGEKFGLWPGTYDWVWKRGWFENFLNLLSENLQTINIIHFSEAIEKHKPIGRIYLPCASYFEMNEWTLPAQLADRYRNLLSELKDEGRFDLLMPFIKGGFWRNFLVKYEESNRMHKIMLYLSERLNDLRGSITKAEENRAKRALYRAQCNCVYWHGVFGGLYLPHLREGVYRNLVECEDELDKATHKRIREWAEGVEKDIDFDGSPEYILRNPKISLYFKPSYGGALTNIFFKPLQWNILDTLMRRFEGYHNIVKKGIEKKKGEGVKTIHHIIASKEENIVEHLNYDWYQRLSFLDHFLGDGTNLDSFKATTYIELGDFVNQPFDAQIRSGEEGVSLELVRDGGVWIFGKRFPVIVRKVITLPKSDGTFSVDYEVVNNSNERIFWFANEMNFGLMSRDFPGRYFLFPGRVSEKILPGQIMEINNINELILVDENSSFELKIKSENEASLWLFPVETVSLSEEGFERVYQETMVLFHFRFPLEPGASFKNRYIWEFEMD